MGQEMRVTVIIVTGMLNILNTFALEKPPFAIHHPPNSNLDLIMYAESDSAMYLEVPVAALPWPLLVATVIQGVFLILEYKYALSQGWSFFSHITLTPPPKA